MKIISYAFILMALLLPFTGSAESKDLLRADYLYRNLAFHDAIPFYEKAIAEEENKSADVYVRLADCYRLTRQPVPAAEWYGRAVQLQPNLPDEAKRHYGEVLMNLQRYDEAAVYLKQYQAARPGDRRAANLLAACQSASQLKNAIPLGSAKLLDLNTDGSDFGPAIRGAELVFTSDSASGVVSAKKDGWTGNPFYSMYRINCDQEGRCSGAPRPITGKLNSKYHDGPAAFSPDGRQFYFTRTTQARQFISQQPVSDNSGTVRLQIMVAGDYDTAAGTYQRIDAFKYNDKNYSTAHPAISPDGQYLVFSSDMPGGLGQTDLYLCKWEAGGWSRPQSLGSMINTEGDEMFPVFLDNERLSFASNGHVGLGGLDVYITKFNRANGSWSEPEHAGTPINSSYDDMSYVTYGGGKYGYFASNRPAAKKGDNIYHFHRQELYLSLQVVDSLRGTPLSQATVHFQNDPGARTEMTGADGRIMTRLYPQPAQQIRVSRPGYQTVSLNLAAPATRGERDTIHMVVKMKSDASISYNVIVLNETTREPIPEPLLVMTPIGMGKADSIRLATGAVLTRSLDPGRTYNVYAVKDNYYGNEKVVSTKDVRPGAAPIVIWDTIFMKRLSVGEIYRVDNIYYDFDKANIREDAKPALNRLLELLQQYPAMRIQVNAHTDCRGKESYNLRLSRERAASVIRYLQQRGIDPKRLQSQGYGETMPVTECSDCDRCSEEIHQSNRRTEFTIIAL